MYSKVVRPNSLTINIYIYPTILSVCIYTYYHNCDIYTSIHKYVLPCGSVVKNPPASQEIREMWVRSLGRDDPLEEGMATCSSILAWRIPRTEEPGGLQSIGLQRVGHKWRDWTCTRLYTYTGFFLSHLRVACLIILRLIHVVACISNPLFFMAQQCFIVSKYQSLPIGDGH